LKVEERKFDQAINKVQKVRRLQLVCFGRIYEHTKLDMHHTARRRPLRKMGGSREKAYRA